MCPPRHGAGPLSETALNGSHQVRPIIQLFHEGTRAPPRKRKELARSLACAGGTVRRWGRLMAEKRRFDSALAPHALRARTSFLMVRLAPVLRKRCTARLSELGITMQHYAVLCGLEAFGKCCNSDLIRWTGIDAADLIAVLNDLQGKMYLSRDRDDTDQRRAELQLWTEGKELRARAEQALEQAENEVFRCLAPNERSTLRELLLRVVDCAG